MREFPSDYLEKYRVSEGPWGTTTEAGNNGAFAIKRGGLIYFVIISDELGWEHVSVSLRNRKNNSSLKRCPTWEEMCWVKDQFWDSEEVVTQYHPPESQYVNCHPYTLHLWRPLKEAMPMPPKVMVG